MISLCRFRYWRTNTTALCPLLNHISVTTRRGSQPRSFWVFLLRASSQLTFPVCWYCLLKVGTKQQATSLLQLNNAVFRKKNFCRTLANRDMEIAFPCTCDSQKCQLSRFWRETCAFLPRLPLSRFGT